MEKRERILACSRRRCQHWLKIMSAAQGRHRFTHANTP
ncbi:hypothetical protein RNAN_3440 [Rheinheimera nanhaiensis E407-8]|uniref:Uncharacterized protein n=1 Tax=Rheinheimera nanhaiensis E407-8 TaxID=562729 RepID=I1E288_9GAMM|nr:hypothetical protein RNAN_3440 [Rheinheimera nanhaiensis E407-8]